MASRKPDTVDEVSVCDEEGSESDQNTEDESGGPAPAAISRARVLPKNTSLKPIAVRGEKKLKNKSIHDRIKDFPDQGLVRRDGELFCGVCQEVLSQKKSSVKKHTLSMKHQAAQARQRKEQKRQIGLTAALKRQDEKRVVGESLPVQQRIYRLEVTEHFLRAGIPLHKVDDLRPILEDRYRLTSSSHLREFIPLILEEERKQVAKEIKGRPISLVFDGTTRLGEAIAIVVRFVDDSMNIQQRLVRLRTVAKSVNAPDLVQVINQCVATQYQHSSRLVVAAMRDGASVNEAAMRTLSMLYPHVFDVICFSHTLNNAGNHFNFPLLDEFTRLWVSFFGHSSRVKLAWKGRTGTAMKSFSETRWWSKWEMMNQVGVHFGDILPFLQENQDASASTNRQLRSILESPDQSRILRLQLAAMMDVGKHFVQGTYALEGDGPLVLECYSKLQAITTALAQNELPNLKAAAREIAEAHNLDAAHLVMQTMAGANPAVTWFLQKFNLHLGDTVAAFRKARFFDPVEAQAFNLTPEKVRSLNCFPFLSDDLDSLVDELPLYLAAIQDVELESLEEKWKWWSRRNDLPHWQEAVKKLVLVQPSSAASERVFSMLTSCFGDQQTHALEETVEASIMLRYNKRKGV